MTIQFEFHPWIFHLLPVIDVSKIEYEECDQHGFSEYPDSPEKQRAEAEREFRRGE